MAAAVQMPLSSCYVWSANGLLGLTCLAETRTDNAKQFVMVDFSVSVLSAFSVMLCVFKQFLINTDQMFLLASVNLVLHFTAKMLDYVC